MTAETGTHLPDEVRLAPIAETPHYLETPREILGHAVAELLTQFALTNGIREDEELRRIRRDKNERVYEEVRFRRDALGRHLTIRQDDLNREISLADQNKRRGLPALATYTDDTQSLDGEGAIIAITEALSDGTVIPLPKVLNRTT